MTTISFAPSAPGMNGSFTGTMAGVYQGVGRPRAQGPYVFNVTNNVSITTYGLTRNYDIETSSTVAVEGYTPLSNPFVNYTGSNLAPSEMAANQIWELGNSLGLITGKQMPAQLRTDPGPDNNEPGNILQTCITKKGG